MSIIKTRTVKATVSDKFCSFSFESTLHEENGVSVSDAINEQVACTELAANALKEFMSTTAIELGIVKNLPKGFNKTSVQEALDELKSNIGTKDNVSPAELEKIKNQPLYSEVKKVVNKK